MKAFRSARRWLPIAILAVCGVAVSQWVFAANSFFNASGVPAQGAALSSSAMRTEFANIGAGFDKMPSLTAGTAVVVNGGGTALTNTVGTLALAGNFATTGAYNTTFVQQASLSITLPATADTLVGRATTDTLTNKTLTSPTINGATLSGTFAGAHTYSSTITGADGGTWGSGGFGSITKLGLGMNATNILDITQTQNAASIANIFNGSNGNSAGAEFRATNDVADTFRLLNLGSGFTANGIYQPRRAVLVGDGPGLAITTASAQPLLFGVNGVETGRFGSDGSFLLGTTSNGGWATQTKLAVEGAFGNGVASFRSTSGSATPLLLRQDAGGTPPLTVYYSATTSVGSVTTNGTTTSYNTSSDQRLKNNIEDAADAGAIIDALRVRQWDWKSNDTHESYGFVAQEEAQVYAPAVIVGDSDPNMITRQWSRDDSKLVPLLVKEIQSLRARVAALEAH